jgi:hypothetical protein
MKLENDHVSEFVLRWKPIGLWVRKDDKPLSYRPRQKDTAGLPRSRRGPSVLKNGGNAVNSEALYVPRTLRATVIKTEKGNMLQHQSNVEGTKSDVNMIVDSHSMI